MADESAPPQSQILDPESQIVLDGAMGTELARRGVDTGLPLWSANALLDKPDIVRQIHEDYLAAGAQVITADTFRTNVRTLERAGLREHMRELTYGAVKLARESCRDRALVAGSIAPVEDCYSPHLVPQDRAILLAEHTELAHTLAEAGCDLLLIETMNTVREAVAATQAAAATGLPVWASFMLGPDNHLLSGEPLRDAVRAVLPFGLQAVLVNCIPVAQVAAALVALRQAIAPIAPGIRIGAYANAGHVDACGDWSMAQAVQPQDYARAAREWLDRGASIVGGCCGTTPEHVRALVALLSD